MKIKTLATIVGCALLAAQAALMAQQQPRFLITGSVSTAGRQVDNNTNSSKFTEYRDLQDDAFLPPLSFELFDTQTRRFFQFSGANVSLNDQRLTVRAGAIGGYTISLDWASVPHNFSNKAQTPYIQKAPGLFVVPAHVPITFKKLNTVAADAANVLASDQLIANYQTAYLRPTSLATQGGFGRIALDYAGIETMKFEIAYDRRKKDGLKSSFGPIGDRPPRTLNIQLTEPVDYDVNDLTVSAEYIGRRFQAQTSYTFSDFANQIDTLLWENIYTSAAPGATYDEWDRSVSVFGRRPLAPDNRYHNASLALAGDLPADSRLSATFAFGWLDQNERLLPYSYNVDRLANPTLPRATAKAQMTTTQALVDYVVNPAERLNLRAWVRYFGLDNNTPLANWQYVTSDTSGLTGTVSYKNKRVNLAYGSDRVSAGADVTYRIRRSTLAFGYEGESVQRDFRQADTAEHRVNVSWRARPVGWANLRARYLYGRRGGDYNSFVTRQSYWYSLAEANDADNPAFTFSDHPDMVKFDVADRRRHQAEFSLALTPRDTVSIAASVRYRNDDFDSDVRSSQPLAVTGIGEVTAATPGNQLGLLKNERLRYSLDASYMPTDRFSINAFLSRDDNSAFQRSLEFNENNKSNPSTVATAELGPWTRASSQWTADIDDDNWTVGFGTLFGIVPNRLNLDATYTVSLGEGDVRYNGFGTAFAPNHQFAFSSPPTVNQDLHALDLRVEVPMTERFAFHVGYSYERFRLDDWHQGTTAPWVEAVGSEFLLRDTSRSHQWGNRLFNLGSFLAPRYDAHIAFASFTYRF